MNDGQRDRGDRCGRRRQPDHQELQRAGVDDGGEHRRPPPRQPGVHDQQSQRHAQRDERQPDRRRQLRAPGAGSGRVSSHVSQFCRARHRIVRPVPGRRAIGWIGVTPSTPAARSSPSTLAVLLVVAAFVVPHLHLGIVTPLINMHAAADPRLRRHRADLRLVERPRRLGHRTGDRSSASRRCCGGRPWRSGCGWRALTLVDLGDVGGVGVLAGDDRRLAARLRRAGSPPDTNICARCRRSPTSPRRCGRSPERILDFQPNSWITHVSGHPPGALLTFVWLDRIGLGGGAWAGAVVLLVGSSAAAAIVVAVRALADEDDRPAGRAVRRGGADRDLDRGVGRRLFRGRRRVGYRAAGAGRPADGAVPGVGRRGCRAVAGLGDLPELRPRR